MTEILDSEYSGQKKIENSSGGREEEIKGKSGGERIRREMLERERQRQSARKNEEKEQRERERHGRHGQGERVRDRTKGGRERGEAHHSFIRLSYRQSQRP